MMRRRYGASPLHLIGHLALFGIVAYVMLQLIGMPGWVNLLAWLLAGALLHDLVLLPAYSGVDGVLRRVLGSRVNFARVPLAISGLLLFMFFPLILGKGDGNLMFNGARQPQDYALAWLLISAGLLLAGAAAAVRRRRAR